MSSSVKLINIFPRHKEPHFKTTFNLSLFHKSLQNFENHYDDFIFSGLLFLLFYF